MASFRRRKFLVVVPFQVRFVAFRMVLLMILSLSLWILVFYPLQVEIIGDLRRVLRGIPEPGFPVPGLQVLLGIAVIFLLMGLMALFESHRIAGPVYRFEKTLRALIDGDFSQRIRLRKYDNFTQLEPVLNQLADRYEQTSRAEQLVRARIGPGLEEVSKLLQQGHPEQARERIEVLQSEVRQVVGASA